MGQAGGSSDHLALCDSPRSAAAEKAELSRPGGGGTGSYGLVRQDTSESGMMSSGDSMNEGQQQVVFKMD